MSVDAVVGTVQVEGSLGALVQDEVLRHKADLGRGPTKVQGSQQHPLFRKNPLSRGVLTTDEVFSSG